MPPVRVLVGLGPRIGVPPVRGAYCLPKRLDQTVLSYAKRAHLWIFLVVWDKRFRGSLSTSKNTGPPSAAGKNPLQKVEQMRGI